MFCLHEDWKDSNDDGSEHDHDQDIDITGDAYHRRSSVLSDHGFGVAVLYEEDKDETDSLRSLKSLTKDMPMGSGGYWTSVGHLLNATLGSGIVGIPFMINEVGPICGCAFLLVFCLLSVASNRMMIRLGKETGYMTFPEMANRTLGLPARIGSAVLLVLHSISIITLDMLVVASILPPVVQHWTQSDFFKRSVITPMLGMMLAVPLSLPTNIEGFGWLAAMGLLCAGVTLILLVHLSIRGGQDQVLLRRSSEGLATRLFRSGGLAMHAVTSQSIVFLIRNNMREPSMWGRVAFSGTVAASMSAVVGALGMVLFADCVKPNFLLGFSVTDEVGNISKCFVAVKLLLTLPTEALALKSAISSIVTAFSPHHDIGKYMPVLFMLIFVLVTFLPSSYLYHLMVFSGGVLAPATSFIFPVILYFTIDNDMYSKQAVISAVSLSIGSCLLFGNLYYFISEAVSAEPFVIKNSCKA